MKVLDLFSGIGGFSLGLESTGFFKTIASIQTEEMSITSILKNSIGGD